MDIAGIAEIVWFAGLAILAFILFIGNRPGSGRGIWVKIGALFLVFGYSGLIKESYLSFYEIEALTWVIRVGITLLIVDMALRTKLKSPKQAIADFREMVSRYKRK